MIIHEVSQHLEANTPKGRGRILWITEYGMETEKLFTVAICDTGELWELTSKDLKLIPSNPKKSPIKEDLQNASFETPTPDYEIALPETNEQDSKLTAVN